MSIAIESIGITKRYGEQKAVNQVSFQVMQGECFGILGPNGAGKTSLFKMLYGSSLISEGELYVMGMSAKDHMSKIKSFIGVLPQEDGLDTDFSVMDNLLIYGSYHRIPALKLQNKSGDLLRYMHLEEYASRPVEELSGGMKRRLALARAILNEPKVLLLDEPTTGLDPQAREWLWEELRELGRKGMTRVLSTHYMEEAEALCDRIIILDKGVVVAEGTPFELISKHIGTEVVEFEVSPREIEYHVQRVKDRYPYQIRRNKVQLHIREKMDVREVLKEISGESIVVRKASLNDVFLKIAGHELRE